MAGYNWLGRRDNIQRPSPKRSGRGERGTVVEGRGNRGDEAVDLRKFIDDYNDIQEVEDIPVQGEAVLIASKSNKELAKLTWNSVVLGMKINEKKTQLPWIGQGGKDKRVQIRAGDCEIWSGEVLTLLGFAFTDKPDASGYVNALVQKFYSKIWVIRKLVKTGWAKNDVCKLYKTVILSTLEYLSPVYLSLLSVEQDRTLEKLHKKALKMIFGWSYN